MPLHPYIPVLLTLAVGAFAAPESPSPAPDKEPQPEAPVEIAVRFVAYLESEQDQQAERGTLLATAFAESGKLAEARRILGLLKGYRQIAGLYQLAGQAKQLGDEQLVTKVFAEAEAIPAGKRDFEVQEIQAARVESLARLGRVEEAREALGTIPSDAVRLETEGLIFEFDAPASVEERAREFAGRKVTSARLKGQALLLAAGTLAKAGPREKALPLTRDAIDALCQGADGQSVPLLRRAVGLLAQSGAQKEAARWAEVCAGFAQRIDPRAYWKTRDVRLSAEALRDAGETAKAEALLKQLPELTTSLSAMDYSRGGMPAAEGFLLVGDEKNFHSAARHIVDHLRTHPHFRARAMAVLDVLAVYVRTKREIPDDVRTAFAATAESIEKDPHYLNPI